MWYVILIVINTNGIVTATAHYPTSPAYNNELDCKEYGQTLSNRIQVERGTSNSKVFWKCENLSYETIVRTMPRM